VLLTLSSFLQAFLKGFEHGGHVCQPFLTPLLLVGLIHGGRLTSGCKEGLTYLVVMMTFARVVCLVCTAVSPAQLAKLTDKTFRCALSYLGTRLDEPPPDAPLLGLPLSGRAATALSFNFYFSLQRSIIMRSMFSRSVSSVHGNSGNICTDSAT
jgi:hypothetical protein